VFDNKLLQWIDKLFEKIITLEQKDSRGDQLQNADFGMWNEDSFEL